MVSINYAFKEIISKIVYYGPGLSGKTTNLQYVFSKVPKEARGELISLATDADRTLYFDFLPVNVGTIRGFTTKFQLYTVPGQVYYNATRKLVLRGVDGLVFVADSQIAKQDDNAESLKNLEENLAEYGYDLADIPLVIQYNKRDLPDIATIEDMEALLNPRHVPYFEAVASQGIGVFATLKAISKMVLDRISQDTPEKPRRYHTVGATVGRDLASSPTGVAEEVRVISSGSRGSISEEEAPPARSAVRVAAEEEKPAIVSTAETLTNVVVSSTGEEEPEQEKPIEPTPEETTEHAVLQEESYVPEIQPPVKKHPAILDADKLSEIVSKGGSPQHPKLGFDEEATQITDAPPVAPKVLSKPYMAESARVKQKKKAGLFGWLKRKN